MFQRFASALFGEDTQELSRCGRPGDGKDKEEDEDWILVNFLAETCSSQHGDDLPGSVVSPDEEEDEDLVMIPSPMASPPIRYASCNSLNSTADTDPDAGAEEEEVEEEEDEVEGGFLRLDVSSLEESWFVTPPPCFTGRSSQPVMVETNPLENLLIEHPSMSVYAHHSPPMLNLDALPRSLDLKLGLLPSNGAAAPTGSGGKEKVRHLLDGPRHRPDVAAVQRRSSLHPACYAALSTRAGLMPQRPGLAGQPLTRNALRRLNLLHPPRGGASHLHQPSQRHLNF